MLCVSSLDFVPFLLLNLFSPFSFRLYWSFVLLLENAGYFGVARLGHVGRASAGVPYMYGDIADRLHITASPYFERFELPAD